MTQNNNNLVTRNNDPEQIDLLDLVRCGVESG